MKYLSIYLIVFLGFSCICGLCTKEEEPTTVEPPGANAAIEYGVNMQSNTDYPAKATFNGEFRFMPMKKDTATCIFEFDNKVLKTSGGAFISNWNLCDANYDMNGLERFRLTFGWIGTPQLTQGKTYNLNLFYDQVPVSVHDSKGYVQFFHKSSTGTDITVMGTFVNPFGSGSAVDNSTLTITSLRDNTASGTFHFAFYCQPAGAGNLRLNYVNGKFSNIPVK